MFIKNSLKKFKVYKKKLEICIKKSLKRDLKK